MKTALKQTLPYLPRFLRKGIRSIAEHKRQIAKAERKQRTQVSLTDLLEQLDVLGVEGDVLLHASLSNIGQFDCPPPQIAAALAQRLMGTSGTLLVPALSYNTTMKEYLDTVAGFDVRNAPNAMGAISSILMQRPDAHRSVHPSHSVVAMGARATYYVQAHESDPTPFGLNSPYHKLTMAKGSIVMLGVGLNSVTNFHVIEDLLGTAMPVKVYLSSARQVPCIRADGSPITVTGACHDPRISAIRQCERARSFLQREGAIRTTPFGESEVSVIDARAFSRTLLQMLLEETSIYGPVQLNTSQRDAVLAALEYLA